MIDVSGLTAATNTGFGAATEYTADQRMDIVPEDGTVYEIYDAAAAATFTNNTDTVGVVMDVRTVAAGTSFYFCC